MARGLARGDASLVKRAVAALSNLAGAVQMADDDSVQVHNLHRLNELVAQTMRTALRAEAQQEEAEELAPLEAEAMRSVARAAREAGEAALYWMRC